MLHVCLPHSSGAAGAAGCARQGGDEDTIVPVVSGHRPSHGLPSFPLPETMRHCSHKLLFSHNALACPGRLPFYEAKRPCGHHGNFHLAGEREGKGDRNLRVALM